MNETIEPIDAIAPPKAKLKPGRKRKARGLYARDVPYSKKAPPPWERDEFRIYEVPAVLMYYWHMQVSETTVYRWAKVGLLRNDRPGERVYLKTQTRAGKRFVTKEHLDTFLKMT